MKNIIKYLLLGILGYYISTWGNYCDMWELCILFTTLVYFLYGIFLHKKEAKILLAFLAPNILMNIIAIVYINEHLYPTAFPIYSICSIIALYGGVKLRDSAKKPIYYFSAMLFVLPVLYYCLYMLPEIRTSQLYKKANKPFPNARIGGLNQTAIKISNLKNKVVILDVWNSRCGACIANFPFVKSIEEAYQADTNVFFALVGDISRDSIGYFKENPYATAFHFKEYLDMDTTLFKQTDIQYLPKFFIIDKKGNLRHIYSGFRLQYADYVKKRIEKQINELLAE